LAADLPLLSPLSVPPALSSNKLFAFDPLLPFLATFGLHFTHPNTVAFKSSSSEKHFHLSALFCETGSSLSTHIKLSFVSPTASFLVPLPLLCSNYSPFHFPFSFSSPFSPLCLSDFLIYARHYLVFPCFHLLSFAFVCFCLFPGFPFLLFSVVASLDQLSPSFSWALLRRPAPTAQSEILEKPPTAAWSRCRLFTPHKPTNPQTPSRFNQKHKNRSPAASLLNPKHPNTQTPKHPNTPTHQSGHQLAPVVINVLDRVAQQSE
jgi:hypothetical protein